jgi:glutaminase
MFPETRILSYFNQLEDLRNEHNRKHPLINVVTITILGVIGGKNHTPQNLANLRHIALNLLKRDLSVRVGMAAKRKMSAWDNACLLKVPCS